MKRKTAVYFAALLVGMIFFIAAPANYRVCAGLFLLLLWLAGLAGFMYFAKKLEKRVQGMLLDVAGEYSAKVEDKQSKINSLQSQINPHFLYNTLECIRSEAIGQGCGSIANMAKSLASFFRYSISSKENIVTIQDELNNIQNYCMIQNYRFENKFSFQVTVEEGDGAVYTYLIPKMTIQPIVENSIFHGLETKEGDCRLNIHIGTTQKDVILTISDNGIGMDEETLQRLRLGLGCGNGQEAMASVHGSGIALYNINQRIKLAFGSNYGINAYSTQGIGTDIEIILPILCKSAENGV